MRLCFVFFPPKKALYFSLFQVDAMKLGVKEFKKEYKNVNIDQIEVRIVLKIVEFCVSMDWVLCGGKRQRIAFIF